MSRSSPTSTGPRQRHHGRRISRASRSAKPGSPGPKTRRTTRQRPAQEVQGQAAWADRRAQPPGAAGDADRSSGSTISSRSSSAARTMRRSIAAQLPRCSGAARAGGSMNKKSMKLFKDLRQNGVRYLRPHEEIHDAAGHRAVARVRARTAARSETCLTDARSRGRRGVPRLALARASAGNYFAAARGARPGRRRPPFAQPLLHRSIEDALRDPRLRRVLQRLLRRTRTSRATRPLAATARRRRGRTTTPTGGASTTNGSIRPSSSRST